MTDNEIIKALKRCISAESCCECGYTKMCDGTTIHQFAFDLINRQKAKIERLIAKVNRLKKYDEERDIRLHARLTENARAEAIKEFVERFKKTIEDSRYNAIDTPYTRACNSATDWCIETADSLKKEMVGDNDAK